jgi:hypothetical protein
MATLFLTKRVKSEFVVKNTIKFVIFQRFTVATKFP